MTPDRERKMREMADLAAECVRRIIMETARPGGAPDLLQLVELCGHGRDHLDTLRRWAQDEFSKGKE